MPTPPSLVIYEETTWSGSGAKSTPSNITWQAGDIVVVLAGNEWASGSVATPSASGLSFSAISGALCNSASDCYSNAWVATPTASGSSVVSSSGSGSYHWGMAVWVWRGSDGIGNVGASGSTANNNLTQSLARSGGNSCVVGGLFDWGAGNTSGYGWTPAVANDRQHSRDGSRYSYYVADWADQGSAGTTPYGLTGISSGPFARLFVEILGTTPAGGNTGDGNADAFQPDLSGSGDIEFPGTGSADVPSPTLSGAASLALDGSGQLGASEPELNGNGQVSFAGSGQAIAPDVSAAGNGSYSPPGVAGNGSIAARQVGPSGAGTEAFTAISGDLAAGKPRLAGDGSYAVAGFAGSGTIAGPKLSLADSGSVLFTGSGTIVCNEKRLSGAGFNDAGSVGGSGNATGRKSRINGTATELFTGSGDGHPVKTALAGNGLEVITGLGSVGFKKPSISAWQTTYCTLQVASQPAARSKAARGNAVAAEVGVDQAACCKTHSGTAPHSTE